MAPWWVPVVSLVVGWAGGLLTDALRDSRAAAREDAAAERARAREQAAFERETLIALQDWLAKLVRASGATHHHDYMEYHQSRRWGRDPIGEEWDIASHEATVNVLRYRVRVADADVRQAVEHVVKLAAAANQGAAYGEDDRQAYARAAAAFKEAVPAYERTQELLGERLRGLV
jgi:hypothetical protein